MSQFFDVLATVYGSRIYNCDESGLPNCLELFLNIVQVSQGRVERALSAQRSNAGVARIDGRGRHVKQAPKHSISVAFSINKISFQFSQQFLMGLQEHQCQHVRQSSVNIQQCKSVGPVWYCCWQSQHDSP